MSVNADPASKTYGDADPAFTYTFSGFQFSDNAGNSSITGTGSCSRTPGQSVGGSPYTITCTPGTLTSPNYSFQTGSTANFAISRRVLSVNAGQQDQDLRGRRPGVHLRPQSGSRLAVTNAAQRDALDRCLAELLSRHLRARRSSGAQPTYTGSPIHLGDLSAGPTTRSSFTTGKTFEITKATLSVNADPASKTYGDADPAFTYTFSGFQFSDDASNSGITGAADCSRTSGEIVLGSPYTITCAPGDLDAANYTFVTGDTADFTISARTLVVTPDDNQSKVYGGSEPVLTYTHGTLYNGDDDSVFTGALSRTAGENVGTYPIHLGDLSAGPNYAISFTTGKTFEITKATLSVNADPASKTYGDADPAFTYTFSGFQFSDDASNSGITGAADCSRTSGEIVLGSPYTITCAPGDLDAANYTFVTGDTADFTISARTLVVTPDDNQSKVYGGSEPVLTYTHGTLYNGDDDSVFTGALSRTAGENVGTYPIHLGDLSAGPNYAISFTTGKTFEITKATLSVNADPASKTYGDADPAFTYTFSGFQFSDNAGNSSITGTGSCSRTLGQSVGGSPYTITCTPGTLTSPNYSFQTGSTANFAISRRVLSVNADNKTKTYGAADPTFTYGFNGFASGENAGNVTISGAASCSRASGETVVGSPYTITCAPGTLSAANYSFQTGSTGTLAITKATLSVNADPASKTYGDADPAFTYTFSGFQFSDNAGNSSITGTGSCSRTLGQSVGGSPYTITCTPGTLTSPNYSFQTGSTANFAISRRVLSVNADNKTKTYGAADPTFTYGFNGFASGENAGNVTISRCCELLAGLRGDGRRLALHDHVCPRDLVGCQLQLPNGLHGHPRDHEGHLDDVCHLPDERRLHRLRSDSVLSFCVRGWGPQPVGWRRLHEQYWSRRGRRVCKLPWGREPLREWRLEELPDPVQLRPVPWLNRTPDPSTDQRGWIERLQAGKHRACEVQGVRRSR